MLTAGLTVQKIAAILGKDPDDLERHAYLGLAKDGRSEYRVYGQLIGRGLSAAPLRLKRPAICPACINEHGFACVCWDVSAYVACPMHRSMLLQQCPACNRRLTWFRPGLLTCGCGASLADAVTAPASAATVELMQVLRSKVLGDPSPVSGEMRCGLPLAQMSAMSLESMLRVIAVLEKLNGEVVPASGGVVAAVEVFAGWPTGFHTYLRRMAREGVASGVQSIGLRKRFTKLYEALFRARGAVADVEFLREAFVAFGLKEWGLATVDMKLRRGDPQQGRYVSARNFAEAAGLMPITVQRWVDEGALKGAVVGCSKQNRYVLDSEGAEGSLRPTGDRIQMREAARRLGCPVSVLRELKRSKQYSNSAVINRQRGFWVVDLDALAARILATADLIPTGYASPTEGGQRLIALGVILQDKKFGDNRAKGALVSALLLGSVTAEGRLNDTIGSILLRACDVDDFRLRFGMHADGDTVTVRVAAAILGCTTHAVDGLLKAGHLFRLDGSRTGIRRASVECFQKQWTSANALAKDLGRSSIWVAGRATALRVPALRVPCRGGVEATFVAVDAVQQVMDDAAAQNSVSMPRAKRPSPGEVRRAEVASLRAYLAELLGRGEPLPMRGGKPNRSEIAKSCNFPRDAFYTNPELLLLLDGDNRRESRDALESHQCAMDRYLNSLSAAGLGVPMRGGKPNTSAIATACGFARSVFYNHPEMGARLATLARDPVPTKIHQRAPDASAFGGFL